VIFYLANKVKGTAPMLHPHGSASKALKNYPPHLLQLSQDIPDRCNCGSLKCTGGVWCRMRNIFCGCTSAMCGWMGGENGWRIRPLVSAPSGQEVPGYRDSQNIWQKFPAYLSAHTNS